MTFFNQEKIMLWPFILPPREGQFSINFMLFTQGHLSLKTIFRGCAGFNPRVASDKCITDCRVHFFSSSFDEFQMRKNFPWCKRSLILSQIKDRRSKKQQKRKEKEKKQRKKTAPDRTTVAPSTLGGRVGEMVDRYRKMTLKEYNDVVELCQMHGVQVSKALLGRGELVTKLRGC